MKHFIVYSALGLLLLGTGCKEEDQPPPDPGDVVGVTFTLSRRAITIGDPLLCRLHVYHEPETAIQLDPHDPAVPFSVIERNQETLALNETRARTDILFSLTSFEIGEWPIFTGSVVAVSVKGLTNRVTLPPDTISVESVLSEEDTEIAPNHGPKNWRTSVAPWVWLFLILVGLPLAVVLLSKLFTRARSRKPPELIIQPPHEKALERFQQLREKGYVDRGEVEPFFVELSAIIRAYLEDRFTLMAPERTTEEFIRDASQSRALSMDHKELVAQFLTESDLVKFARHTPGAPEMNAAMMAAEQLVHETTSHPTPEAVE